MDELNIGDAIKNFRADNANKEALGVIKDLLDRNNIDIDEVGKISRVSLYQTAAKDADGEI